MSGVVYLSQFYSPTIALEREKKGLVLEPLLKQLRQEGEEVTRQLNKEAHAGVDLDAALRVNVMIVRRHRDFRRSKYLQIDHYLGDYSDAELEQTYNDNIGCCGTALHDRKPTYFDRDTVQEPFKGLTATQRQVTQHVASILSVPVFPKKAGVKSEPIAVLNVDSPQRIGFTHFDDEKAIGLATKYASLIALLH